VAYPIGPVIDGYSVQEAASVLGVAEGRVWELLARGVLTGTPEGDSMRVFLKPQPGPIAPAREEPRTNGNGGSHGNGGEASAFRELLTEFRNLTERYGQALLALGEARGEVAGLRSRVDQLEARLDLRLPPPVDAAPVAWDSLTVPASAPEEATARPQRATPRRATPRKPARRKQRPRKERSPREAVAGFADALARAQDPNAADLGETTEETVAAEPITEAAGVAFEVAAEVAAEVALDEEPEAEAAAPEPVAAIEETPAEVEPPTYSAAVVEPDWFADGDFAWLDAADMEGSTQAAAAPVTPEAAEPEPEEAVAEAVVAPEAMVAAEPELEPEPQAAQEPEIAREPAVEAEPEPQAAQEPEIAPEPAVEAEAATAPSVEATGEFGPAAEFESEATFESEAAFEPEAEFETWQPPAPVVRELPDEPATADAPEPPTMNTAVAVEDVEEEVMWLGREAEPAPRVEDEPPLDYRAEAEGWPEVDAAPAVQAARPPLAMTEDELARLALDEGWDDSEVAAIRAMITPPSSATVDLPGAAELHEAMAALDAVPVRTDPQYDASRQWSKPTPDDEEEPARNDDWAFEAEPAPPPPAPARPPIDVTSTLRHSADDPGWLERRQGPAAAAYRRLRRLLPG
jgi:hypothetical protein